MNKAALLGLMALGLLACSSPASDEGVVSDGRLALDAEFGSFRWSSASQLCPASGPCSRSLEIRADGQILVDGTATNRVVSAENMSGFAALATGQEFVNALRAGTDCYAAADGSSWIELSVAPGLSVVGSADCGGIIREVVDAAEAVETFGADAPLPWPAAPARARIDEPLVFGGLELQHETLSCAEGQSCAVGLSILDGFIHRGDSNAVQLPEAELSSFATLALSDAVMSALMTDTPCPSSGEVRERLLLTIGTGLRVSGEIAGCGTGPVAELRGAVTDLADRYTGAS
jgi:hypothetical protein